MNRKYFGTDGIRGTANQGPMTAETALRVGLAAGRQFTRGGHRHRVVIGKDTRLSGYMIEPALTAGFISMGLDVILVGPMPTPAVAMLTRSLRADLGVMITASHNPYEDNGIKLFGPDGYKLSDDIEGEIEARMDADMAKDLAPPGQLGQARRLDDAQGRYIEYVKSTFPKALNLEGLKIVVDCANGAAYRVAPTVLWELGAEVVAIAIDPDGFNINKGCGSVASDYMCEQVVTHKADIGFALDGDADRLVVSDETGRLADGDQLMALIATSWLLAGELRGGGVVGTVMSNLGLEQYLEGLGLTLVRAPVGDRYVVDHMRNHGFNLGGEQSGHIILGDIATTGDGLIAALQCLAVLVETGQPASQAIRVFEPLPQTLKSVRLGEGVTSPLDTEKVKGAIADGESRLGDSGRVLVRKSGTEPVVRVMAEGEDEPLVRRVVDDIVQSIESCN
ncbi:MAG: phosphoglucosamine mutase [Proteobacteria bacterium]|nr:phosphoglucosamine mutase [Pseudomonadota bacterium]